MVYFGCIIGLLIVDGLIIKHINIPIFQAILGAMVVGGIL